MRERVTVTLEIDVLYENDEGRAFVLKQLSKDILDARIFYVCEISRTFGGFGTELKEQSTQPSGVGVQDDCS